MASVSPPSHSLLRLPSPSTPLEGFESLQRLTIDARESPYHTSIAIPEIAPLPLCASSYDGTCTGVRVSTEFRALSSSIPRALEGPLAWRNSR